MLVSSDNFISIVNKYNLLLSANFFYKVFTLVAHNTLIPLLRKTGYLISDKSVFVNILISCLTLF